MKVYNCHISELGVEGEHLEAFNLSLDVLAKLGCRFPKMTVFQAGKVLSSVLNTIHPTNIDITDLPLMTDVTKKACLKLMRKSFLAH